MNFKTKTFDVIAWKRRVQAEIYECTKDMTPEEEIEYFHRRAEEGPLGEWWKRVKEAQQKPQSDSEV